MFQTYDLSMDLKVNDTIEVIGVLSVDPLMAATFSKSDRFVKCIETLYIYIFNFLCYFLSYY